MSERLVSERRRPRIFTLGHSNRSEQETVALLSRCAVRVVADVRSNPASAGCPVFERAALSGLLEKVDIGYRWFRSLGERQPPRVGQDRHAALSEEWQRRYAEFMGTPQFVSAVEELEGLAASATIAVLSAERDPFDSHRSFIADRLVLDGFKVVHLIDERKDALHETNGALLEQDGELVYAGRQLRLV